MAFTTGPKPRRQTIAVIGSGIAGMSAAWLLSRSHEVTVYEKNARPGGHSNTVMAQTSSGAVAVDTGFIVFNHATYPNLVALFAELQVAIKASDMSFAVSLNGGRTEYSSRSAAAFLCGGRNALSPRFWSMTRDLIRFYREAPADIAARSDMISLGAYLRERGYSEAFQHDHLLAQAAAIWSASAAEVSEYPASAFVRFFENHGLLKLKDRPAWSTVAGGSCVYVEKLIAPYAKALILNAGAISVRRDAGGAWVGSAQGAPRHYDGVVIAAHADEALAMLHDPSAEESRLLGAFRYTRNKAVLHTDRAFMPKREKLWASWNYLRPAPSAEAVGATSMVSYWMNRLQDLRCRDQIFLTLNPNTAPRAASVLYETEYEHPLFDGAAMRAQRALWRLQGVRSTWFCGAYFGAGFHEDALQAGLAAAEDMGGVRRPWTVANPSGRIFLGAATQETEAA